jgi:hypothetical protein
VRNIKWGPNLLEKLIDNYNVYMSLQAIISSARVRIN